MIREMYFLIGADIVPTASNAEYFKNGDAETLCGSALLELLNNAEYRIFNLEVPLTDKEHPITKFGPGLIAPSAASAGYKALGIDLLTLANNHILDQDADGLNDTISALQANDIAYLGAGNTQKEAAKPYFFRFGEKRIAVYACAEHEFSIVTEQRAGANPFDPLYTPDAVAELRKNSDFVIVLYHGGKEHYRYPSPSLQKTCRRLIEKGAGLVICQHSHCIGCAETYLGGTIVYGQGNFLFDMSNLECWQNGLLVQVDQDFNVNYVPVMKQENTVRLAQGEDAEAILHNFHTRSEEIKKPGFIESSYRTFAEDFLDKYLRMLHGKNSIFTRLLNKLSGNRYATNRLHKVFTKHHLLGIRNYIECEAHSELLLTGLKAKIDGLRENIDD